MGIACVHAGRMAAHAHPRSITQPPTTSQPPTPSPPCQHQANSSDSAPLHDRSKPTNAMPLLRKPPTTTDTPSATSASSHPRPHKKPAIPDFLLLPPDERQRQRDTLVGALQPTPDMMHQIKSDPILASGFEDEEVMLAVAEIAADPSALGKWAKNQKVMRFYLAMGQLVGSQLEGLDGGGGPGGGKKEGVAVGASDGGVAMPRAAEAKGGGVFLKEREVRRRNG